ncbi:MAG: DUF1987 domain-containing protein [Bacteroidales bacterium]|nr:DUF1987 domain-containing protein [Bacteroidales bacterium]
MVDKKGKDVSELAYSLFKDTQKDNLEYVYRGKFNTDITDNILSLAEQSLKFTERKLKIKKRVYFVMVEGLQNITRHQDITAENIPVKPGFFALQRKSHSYFITTGNLIAKDHIKDLKEQLENVNKLSKDDLDFFYKKHLKEGSVSIKGGAGLGLIEIARKSKGTLSYDFRKITDNYYYFYLLTEIPFEDIEFKEKNLDSENSLENIEKLHDTLNKENILLNYSGIFNQENLVDLLGIIEKQMKGTVILKIKTFNIMVEVLQNLVKHSDYYVVNDVGGNYGIFFITENDDEFILTSGNYIKNEKVKKLESHLNYVNSLNVSELNTEYNKILAQSGRNKDKSNTGLGLIDIRLKSTQKNEFYFYKTDEKFSFYTLRIHIKKIYYKQTPLIIEAKSDSPYVNFSPAENKFCIKGRSFPAEANKFYHPIQEWIKEYIKKSNSITIFEFKLEYINTQSMQQIYHILELLKQLSEFSKVKIKWYYEVDNQDIVSIALRFKELLKIEIKLIETKD